MTTNLWSENHPRNFWQCQPDPSDEDWGTAIAEALPVLGLPGMQPDIDNVLAMTLGEGRFGPDHWKLSFPKRVYYLLKPLLPRALTRLMRRAYRQTAPDTAEIQWPTETRYAAFLWDVLARIVRNSPGQRLPMKSLWPDGHRLALVLTHDVEAQAGLEFVRNVADLEESLGFRSSFNFVPEDYPIDTDLINKLRQRGFEVGLHGLKHDGRLFNSRTGFEWSAVKINNYLSRIEAAGFRSPLTLRDPEWMQSLEVEYDLSFFDTDPFEPIPGGTMSIWPFFIGHFVELPYTLVQDYTLTDILKEDTPRVWLEKVEYIRDQQGMALINSHPDYLRAPFRMDIYSRFLSAMQEEQGCWRALPRDVARWWRARPTSTCMSTAVLREGKVCIEA